VRDLQKSVEFYEFGHWFGEISESFKGGQHVRFRIVPSEQLHLAGGATDDAKHEIHVHIVCLMALASCFIRHLDQMHVKYVSIEGEDKTIPVRADGVKQIYF
jgi:hypothetical protein